MIENIRILVNWNQSGLFAFQLESATNQRNYKWINKGVSYIYTFSCFKYCTIQFRCLFYHMWNYFSSIKAINFLSNSTFKLMETKCNKKNKSSNTRFNTSSVNALKSFKAWICHSNSSFKLMETKWRKIFKNSNTRLSTWRVNAVIGGRRSTKDVCASYGENIMGFFGGPGLRAVSLGVRSYLACLRGICLQETSKQCWLNVVPASMTLAQHLASIWSIFSGACPPGQCIDCLNPIRGLPGIISREPWVAGGKGEGGTDGFGLGDKRSANIKTPHLSTM